MLALMVFAGGFQSEHRYRVLDDGQRLAARSTGTLRHEGLSEMQGRSHQLAGAELPALQVIAQAVFDRLAGKTRIYRSARDSTYILI